jgi:predicted Zn-dependent protease
MNMMKFSGLVAGFASLCVVAAGPPAAAKEPEQGVKVGGASMFRHLVSAEKIEQTGEHQYAQLVQGADRQKARLPDDHPQVIRLRAIAQKLLPFAGKFNERAKAWKWEVNVFNSKTINAFCMPGGKIAFYTGILDTLKLTDDEVAMVMGHEIAHALREHARERMGKQMATQGGALVVGVLTGSNVAQYAAQQAGGLLGLKFSRDDETEADLVGMELAARAGFDPRSGIALWTKMGAAAKGAPPQWLSTHPSGQSRIETIKRNLKDVMPLYEAAIGGPAVPLPGSTTRKS